MTMTQQIITIGLCILGTLLTRFLPFFVFSENRKNTGIYSIYRQISALGGVRNARCLLLAQCQRFFRFTRNTRAYFNSRNSRTAFWKRQMLLSIAGGTVCYMLLVHFFFA